MALPVSESGAPSDEGRGPGRYSFSPAETPILLVHREDPPTEEMSQPWPVRACQSRLVQCAQRYNSPSRATRKTACVAGPHRSHISFIQRLRHADRPSRAACATGAVSRFVTCLPQTLLRAPPDRPRGRPWSRPPAPSPGGPAGARCWSSSFWKRAIRPFRCRLSQSFVNSAENWACWAVRSSSARWAEMALWCCARSVVRLCRASCGRRVVADATAMPPR